MQENGASLQTNKCSNRFSINGESTQTVGIRGGMFPGQTLDKRFPQNSGQFQPAGKLVWVRKPRGRLTERGVPAVRTREGSIGLIYRRQNNTVYVREPVTIEKGTMKFIAAQATERVEGQVFIEDIGDGGERYLRPGDISSQRCIYGH